VLAVYAAAHARRRRCELHVEPCRGCACARWRGRRRAQRPPHAPVGRRILARTLVDRDEFHVGAAARAGRTPCRCPRAQRRRDGIARSACDSRGSRCRSRGRRSRNGTRHAPPTAPRARASARQPPSLRCGSSASTGQSARTCFSSSALMASKSSSVEVTATMRTEDTTPAGRAPRGLVELGAESGVRGAAVDVVPLPGERVACGDVDLCLVQDRGRAVLGIEPDLARSTYWRKSKGTRWFCALISSLPCRLVAIGRKIHRELEPAQS